MKQTGIVYLIGAGPGDPGLITVRGLERLAQADVVVYDRLINPDLLNSSKLGAELIYAGKRPDHHTLSQAEINQILVTKAQTGLKVARLKGGDPFVFGRGGEEAQVLVQAGLPFEIIPGITSAVAAPAYAGIPVTHRAVAGSFAVITGHRRKEFDDAENGDVLGLDWAALSRVDTLVFLMGVSNLSLIAEQLAEAGRSPQTPVALIHYGTTPQQQVITGNLKNISERADAANLRPPAVIIVGDVVALRDQIQWFEILPLFGKRVVVTRSRAQASRLSSKIRALGGDPFEFPTIAIEPPQSWESLDEALRQISSYDWVVFTSVNGVDYFWQRLEQAGKDARSLSCVKLAAIGPATAEALLAHGLRADLVPEEYVSEAILESILPVDRQHILLPRADIAREDLADGLRKAGAQVTEVTAYQTKLSSTDKAEELHNLLEAGEIDVLTFTSSSTVRNFIEILGPLPTNLGSLKVACIGPITAGTARELGLPVHIVAEEYTIDGLVTSLIDYFTN